MKSLSPYEVGQLEKILPAYVAHFQANPDSLLTRFCGLYSVDTYEREGEQLPLDAAAARLLGKDKVTVAPPLRVPGPAVCHHGHQATHHMSPDLQTRTYFVIMSNVLYSPLPLHERYDLKGSTLGRVTKEPSDFRKSELVMKDLDLLWSGAKLCMPPRAYKETKGRLERDVAFLRSIGVMDYSLLVGIHFRGQVCSRRDRLDASPPAAPD